MLKILIISLLVFSKLGKIRIIKITNATNPEIKKIFLRLFLALEPTNPDITYNLFTSLDMSKTNYLLFKSLGSKE